MQLRRAGIPDKETQKFLNPARELLNIPTFWQYQSNGLAAFLSSNFFLTYRLPQRFEKLAVAANRFHLKPLLPLLSGGRIFFVLALSQNAVTLYRGSRDSMSVVNLDRLPDCLSDALKYDEPDKQLQYHTGTRQRRGMRAAMFHGHGAGIDDKKDDLLQFFRKIDKGLQPIIAEEDAPMILASVDYYWPIFREASSYSHVVDEGIKGNPEEMDEDELHERAWRIIQPMYLREQEEASAAFIESKAKAWTSTDLKIVVPAAHQGKVALLFVALGIQKWGVYKPRKKEVFLHEKAKATNQDLLDLAALQTILNGGKVFALAPEEMPDHADIAAIFRY